MKLNIGSSRATDLGTGATAALSATCAFEATAANLSAKQSLVASDLVINGIAIGASSADDDSVSSSEKSASAVAKAAAINRASAQTGVSAVVGKTVMTGSAQAAAALTGTITINGQATATIATTTNNAANRTLVTDAINAISGQTGVRAIDTGDDLGGVRLEAADGRNVTVALNTVTAASTGVKAGVQSGTYNLVSNNGNPVVVSSTSSGQVSRSGLQVGTYDRGVSAATTDSRAVATTAATALTLNSGDLKLNGIAIRASSADDDTSSDTTVASSKKEASAIAIAAAINASSAESGVTAKANALTIDSTTTTVIAIANEGAKQIGINGVTIDNTLASADSAQATRDNVAKEINKYTGVTASDNGKCGLALTAADGRNVSVAFETATGTMAANFGLGGASVRGTGTAYTVATAVDVDARPSPKRRRPPMPRCHCRRRRVSRWRRARSVLEVHPTSPRSASKPTNMIRTKAG